MMKKVMLFLLVGIFLVSFVIAQQGGPIQYGECGDSVCDSGENTQSYPYYCPQDCSNNEDNAQNTALQNQQRIKNGNYMGEGGQQMMIQKQSNNKIKLKVNNISANCGLNITEEKIQNKTKLKATLSNGRNAEIKIMPNTASKKALERLRLKNCVEEEGCLIELKEVGSGEQAKLAYELKTQRQSRILGLFKARMQVQAQINAETGEVIKVKKPWWAFLASEPTEE